MSRHSDRSDLDMAIRVRLIDDDLDRVESQATHDKNTLRTLIDGVKYELTAEMTGMRKDMTEGFRECEARDDATRKLLTGLLISIVTLCVTVTAGVLVAVGGG